VGLKVTFGQWECSKFDFGAKTPKSTFLNKTEKHHSNFFIFLLFAIDVSQKQKKSEKKSCRLRRRPLYVDLALLGFFGTFAFLFAKFRISTRQALCFHPYRPWVGSVTTKKFTETKCSKLDPQKELIDPKMAIKVPKVPTKILFLAWNKKQSPLLDNKNSKFVIYRWSQRLVSGKGSARKRVFLVLVPNLAPKPGKRVFGHFFCPKFDFEAAFG